MMVMLVRFSGAPPLVVRGRFCAGLVVPTRWLPNVLLVAESVAVGGVTLVPVSDTDCGLSAASSVMFTVAARVPGAAGVKLTLIVQLAPGATEPAPLGQVLPAAKAKSAACAPVMVMPVRFSGAPPLLVSVTFCAALVVPEASAKSPALAPPSTAVAMLRGAVPLLVRVTVCTGLGVLTR